MKHILVLIMACFVLFSCKTTKEKDYVISIVVKDESPVTGISYETQTEAIKCKTDMEAYKKGLNSFYAIKLTGAMLANDGIKATIEGVSFVVYNKDGIDIKAGLDQQEAALMETGLINRVEKEKEKGKKK